MKKNLYLVMFESAITAGLLAMAIMTPFFNSIGLNQEEIALTQAVFTIVVCTLNIPAGWVADRFSRKWANVIGDFGAAFTFLFYATADSFLDVVIAESLLGVFLAFSQGVDTSLLLHFSKKIDKSDKTFKKTGANLAILQNISVFTFALLGGPIGAIDFRLAIALSGVGPFLGGLASLFIKDDSERLEPSKSPIEDMTKIVVKAFKNKELRKRIFAFAIGREMTHGIIWVYTPMLLLAGVPLELVSIGWALTYLMSILGSMLARKFAHKMTDRQVFALPFALIMISMGTLFLCLNKFTIWVYLLNGIVQGWTGATLIHRVHTRTSAKEQTSVASVAKVVAQMIYVPIVWLIGVAADIEIRYACLATLIIFVPLGLLVIRSLKTDTNKKSP